VPRSLQSPRHRKLAELVAEQRRAKGLSQQAVAARLGRHQPFVANVESGQRRLDVIEFLQVAKAIGFDPRAMIGTLLKIKEPGRLPRG
jgi:transcriptional regulator with XRE-family HTH domain